MRGQVGADPGPSYNLARSWAHYGSDAGGPSVGAIVVWRHHVGKIVGHENGQWIVQSGNDGHAVRTRARSVAGAIAFRRA
jgi:pyrimidine deaminase RibD-like protein